jgi:hypothetical protein
MVPLIALLVFGAAVQAQNNLSFEQYLRGLGDALKANQLGILSNALGAVNGSESGAALLEVLYRGLDLHCLLLLIRYVSDCVKVFADVLYRHGMD